MAIIFGEIINFLLENWLLSLILTISGIMSLGLKVPWKVYKEIYLRFSMRHDPDLEFFFSLIETFDNKNDFKERKNEAICNECGNLINVGTHKKVKVLDINGDILFQMHRKCIEDTDHIIMDYNSEKSVFKLYELNKLWKYEDKPAELPTRVPKITKNKVMTPQGEFTDYIIFHDVEPIEINEIKDEITEISSKMAEKYDNSSWGKEFYENARKEFREKTENGETYAYHPKYQIIAREIELENGEKHIFFNKDFLDV